MGPDSAYRLSLLGLGFSLSACHSEQTRSEYAKAAISWYRGFANARF